MSDDLSDTTTRHSKPKQKNILMIIVDDLTPDVLQVYNKVTFEIIENINLFSINTINS